MPPLDQRQVYHLIERFAGQANVLTIPRLFIDWTGDHISALLLSQIIYWFSRTKDSDGWFYKSAKEWQDELGISDYQLARELGDQAPLTSTTTRLTNLYRNSGLELDTFLDLLIAARGITQERTAAIRTPRPDGPGPKPKMAYWFTVLEDLIGQAQAATGTGTTYLLRVIPGIGAGSLLHQGIPHLLTEGARTLRLQIEVGFVHAEMLGQPPQPLNRRAGDAGLQVPDIAQRGAKSVDELLLGFPAFLAQLLNRLYHGLPPIGWDSRTALWRQGLRARPAAWAVGRRGDLMHAATLPRLTEYGRMMPGGVAAPRPER